MRPLTDRVPKPLLVAGGRSLIEWQIARLVRGGLSEIVVNVSHLGERIEHALGGGSRYGARIAYSREPVALETAGGIAQALAVLGGDAFVAVNADVYCEYDYGRLAPAIAALTRSAPAWTAYLVLVDNPEHHNLGDFGLADQRVVPAEAGQRLTFSGIAVYRPQLFADIAPGERRALGPLLHARVAAGEVYGEHYRGRWMDVGTPQRLAVLQALLGTDG